MSHQKKFYTPPLGIVLTLKESQSRPIVLCPCIVSLAPPLRSLVFNRALHADLVLCPRIVSLAPLRNLGFIRALHTDLVFSPR